MKKIFLLGIIGLVILGMSSCTPDDNFLVGKIIDSGDPAVDGCGWLLEVGSETFKPTNLSTDFQQDGLDVNVDFANTNFSFSCGFSSEAYDEIIINDIEEL